MSALVELWPIRCLLPDAGVETTRPKVTFADVGACDDVKTPPVQDRLNPGKLKRYLVWSERFLLHGPRGTGRVLSPKPTAGEFGLPALHASPSQLTSMLARRHENNIRGIFSQAIAHKPVLVFIDEIDTLGAARVNIREAGDLGGLKLGIRRRCSR